MDFEIGFTDKEITPWGGMALMKKMLDQSRIDDLIRSLGFTEPGSNSGYRAEHIIKSFWVSVWCGANRFHRWSGFLGQATGVYKWESALGS